MLSHTLLTTCTLLMLSIPSSLELTVVDPQLEIVKQWDLLRYDFPWNWPVYDRTLNNPLKIVMTGVAIGRNRLFVSTPRLYAGVPATLSAISKDSYDGSPVLQAYPNWSHHEAGLKTYNCSNIGLVSVYRSRIDSCNRLWVIDAGVSRSFEDSEKTCPPKILVYDLNTDQVVKRIDFPREVLRKETLLTNMVIDETMSEDKFNCEDLFVYITDTVVPAIIVYDSENDLTWRVTHPAMHPDDNWASSEILGDNFTLADGIIGLALDEEKNLLYFQPYATDRLFSVPTKSLRTPLRYGEVLPVQLVGHKSSQGIGLAVAPVGGAIFFSPIKDTAIVKWNSHSNDQEILATDQKNLQFTAEIRISDNDPGALWVMSSKFHRVFLNNLNPYEINTRIIRIPKVVAHRQPVRGPPLPHSVLYNYYSGLYHY